MRAVVQRVRSARVTVGGERVGEIGRGLLVFLGVAPDDHAADVSWLAAKLATLRIFDDADGRMNLAVVPAGGEILVVSKFTLFASTQKGNRPSFHAAARPEHAVPLYEAFLAELSAAAGRPVATGRFGAMMQVELVNDGPVTLLLDSRTRE